MELWEGFLYGVLGGFLTELLGLFRLRHVTTVSFPEWLRSPFYWIITAFMVLAGGVLVVVYIKSNITLSALIAVNIGVSAPLIIGTLAAQAPDVQTANID